MKNSKKTTKKNSRKNAKHIVEAKPTKTAAAKTPAPKTSRGPSLLDHAAAILKSANAPMNAKAITDKVLATTSWQTKGKTPHSTLYAAIIREIAEKGKESRFTKADRGQFAFNV